MSTSAKALYRIDQTIHSPRYRSLTAYCCVIKMSALLRSSGSMLLSNNDYLSEILRGGTDEGFNSSPHLVPGAPMSWRGVALKVLASF